MILSFDLDGVLIINPFYKGIFPEVAKVLAPRVEGQTGLPPGEAHTRLSQLIASEAKARLMRGDFVSAYDWDDIYNTIARTLGSSHRFDVGEMVARFCRVPGMIDFYHPDVPAVLQRLTEAGHYLVAVTNGFGLYQIPVLEALDIARYFKDVITPDRAGYAKPDPEIFNRAKQGADEQVAVHIGDTLSHDVFGAKRADFHTVWVYPDLPAAALQIPPGRRVTEWTDLRGALRTKLSSEFCVDAYPCRNPESCLPDYVVANVGELDKVLQSLLQPPPIE